MAGMRDKLIHQHFGVDTGAVWDSINEDLPSLKSKIIEMLPFEKTGFPDQVGE